MENTKGSVQYQRVEFSVDGLPAEYQFKIRNMDSMPMCIVITENSSVLPRLKVGHRLKMKYYSADSVYQIDLKETAISEITKDKRERFKGSSLVGLEILEN